MYKTVAEYYEGQSVFITGATGFLGKVLLEKLLYSCPGLEKVYILVREKKNISPQQRIDNMIDLPIFSRVRNERPQALKKIVPIVGDIAEPKLGMKVSDEELLINEVTLVFHLAAIIKFDKPLDEAINNNLTSTESIIELSRRMKNIKTFLYVSTAYSNTNCDVIEEIIYPPKVKIDELKKLLKNGLTDKQAKKLLEGTANTYTFTKALAEHVVAENHVNVPSIIIRPSTISCCIEEPLVSWLDCWMAQCAIINGISKGWSHVMVGNSSNIFDLIPVDYVSNLIIVAALKTECSKDITVYNCSTSSENPITLRHFMKIITDDSYNNKFYDLPFPFVYFTRFKWLYFLLVLILQMIPACIADIFLLLRGQNARYIKIQKKVAIVNHLSEYFSTHSWKIRASKTRALSDSLSPSDKKSFPFDARYIVWEEYVPTFCRGIRKFLCKN